MKPKINLNAPPHPKESVVRVDMDFRGETAEKVQELADKAGISCASAVRFLVVQALEVRDAMARRAS